MSAGAEQVVDALCALDLDSLDLAGLQDQAQLLELLAGRLFGRRDQVLAELDVRGQGNVQTNPGANTPALYQSVQGWWRDTSHRSGSQAGKDLRRAAILRRLPLIGQAVVDAVLTPAQAAVLCGLDGKIPDPDLRDSQAELVHVAQQMNPEALGQWVRHLIATHCEPALDREQGQARDKRYLQITREPDGTTRGRFILADEDAEIVLSILEPLARPDGASDKRSAGQRRADALVDVFAGAAKWMDLPHAGGQRPHLSYVVDGDWAAGAPVPSLPEQLARQGLHPRLLEEHTGAGAWTGPQTRAQIEAVLCDARISRVVLDGRGAVVALHSLTDQITTAQRRAVSARDRHCIAKGCHRPPAFCDVHHLTHREHGGATTVENLALLCRRHHVLWHRGTLRLEDLHTPWLDPPDQDALWDGHAPPLIA